MIFMKDKGTFSLESILFIGSVRQKVLSKKSHCLLSTNPMREISPSYNLSTEEFLALAPPEIRQVADSIRQQKIAGDRLVPSTTIIDCSNFLTTPVRFSLIDKVALLVDENLFGGSEMCIQFSMLLSLALQHLGLQSRVVLGTAIYYKEGKEAFRWNHAWVRVGDEIIDANVDCLMENPKVPKSISISPYWGQVRKVPRDRMLREKHGETIPKDSDVEKIWWPDLLEFMNSEFESILP
jgi:hypothetical protein